MHASQERLRIHAHHHDHDQQRDEHRELTPVQVRQVAVLVLVEFAEQDALCRPEHVDRTQHHAARRDDGVRAGVLEGAEQDQELAHEPIQPRQPNGRQRDDHEHHRVDGHAVREAAEGRNLARVAPLVEHPHQEEQRARGEPVIEHLVQRTFQTLAVPREQPQHDEAQVAHRRVGDQLLEIGLHHGHQRAIDDADDRQQQEHRQGGLRRLREERNRETHEAVAAHLEQDGGQNHRTRGRRLDVRVRQPGVQRPHRHLDGEGEREGREIPNGLLRRDAGVVQAQQVERVLAGLLLVLVHERQDGDQHEQRPRHRVHEELEGGVQTAFVAPNPDQEIHRDESHFPEDVEQEQIQAQENAHHAGLQEQQENVEFAHPVGDTLPGCQHRERPDETGQDHEPQTDAVDAQVILDAEALDPRHALDELHAATRGHEPAQERQAEREVRQHAGQGQQPHGPGRAARQKQQRQRGEHRQEDDGGQQTHGALLSR